MTLVLATSNPGKLREMKMLLVSRNISVISKDEAGFNGEIEETGATFRENALIKATAVSRATGLPAVADDSGLCVDALGGEPGVFSRRYGDTDSARMGIILERLSGVTDRTAKFAAHIACVFPEGSTIEASGVVRGEIALIPRGSGGFGYDPIFLLPDKGLTMAEISADDKNAISHRGAAMREFLRLLTIYLEENCVNQ